MGLQSSGAISLNQLHVEVGGTSGTICSLNDSDIRGLIGVSNQGSQNIQQYYGSSSITPAYDSTATTDLTGDNASGTIALSSVAVGDILVLQILSSNLMETGVTSLSPSNEPSFSGSWSTAIDVDYEWQPSGATWHTNRLLYRRVNATNENSYSIANGGGSSNNTITYVLHRFIANATSVTHNDVEIRAERDNYWSGGNGENSFNHTINAGSAGGSAIAIASKAYYGGNASTSHPNYSGVALSTSPSTSDYSRSAHFAGTGGVGVSHSDIFVRYMDTGSDITVASGSTNGGTGYLYAHTYLTMS